ncbi:MAG: oligosaccharide flippase family protein [Clostridia bacterium]|nr:oligosaccharide flippase family protein [Clostridia bacterium]
MKTPKNQLGAGVILSYLGQGIQILLTLFYTPVMLRLLGPSEYGVYQIAFSMMGVLTLFNFGFSNSYIKFFSEAKKSEDAQKRLAGLNGLFLLTFVGLAILVSVIGAVLTVHLDTVLGNNLTPAELDTARIVFPIMVLNCAISFLGVVFRNYITANERFIALQAVDIFGTVLNPCLTFPLLLLGKGSVGMALILLLVTVVKDLFAALYCLFGLRMRFSCRELPFRAFRSIAVFSFYIFVENVVTVINLNVDRFLLGRMIGSVAAAIYAVAGQIHTLYSTLSVSISAVFAPRVNRMVARGKSGAELSALFIRVGKIQFSAMYLILGGFAVFGRRFMRIWAGQEYDEAYWIALILLLSVTPHLVQHVAIEIQRAMGLQKYRSLICGCASLIKLGIGILLIYLWGGIGAALSTAVAYALSTTGINIFYAKRAGLRIGQFWCEILRMALGGIPPLACGLLLLSVINSCHIVLYFALIAAFALLYAASMYTLGLRSSDRAALRSLLKSRRVAPTDATETVHHKSEV